MNAMVAATDEQMGVLDSLVMMAQDIERSIGGMQAARDGVLALASRLSLVMAEDAGGVDAADLTLRSVAAEFAGALRVSDRTMQRRIADAELKVERFAGVWAAQGAGRISAGHARVIIDAGMHIEDAESRAAYTARVLEFAEDESPNLLRPIADRLAQQYQPQSLEERHAEARASRGVWVRDQPEGMAELGILGPAALVHGAFERITTMATVVTSASRAAVASEDADAGTADLRTLSQTRADLALDLLLTGTPGGHDTPDGLLSVITARISVTVPVTSLIGAGGAEAELDGRCPIDPATARMLAGGATGWDRVLTHPINGGVLAVDRYRPSEALKRHLIGRDQRCRFPGCGMHARRSDLDHTKDAALGGLTEEGNLAALCRRHHILKHHSPWQVRQTGNGLLEWTSPTGRIYIDRPPAPNTVTFSDSTAFASTERDGAPQRARIPAAHEESRAGRRSVYSWASASGASFAPF